MSSISPVEPGHPVEDEPGPRGNERPSLLDLEVPPLIQRGQEAFRRDLPELLEKHAGKWVAYSGDRRIGVGRSQSKLYQQCLRQGLDQDEFIVLGIEPEVDWAEFCKMVEKLNPVEEELPPEIANDRSWAHRPVPPLIQRGQEAFSRDLPELLKKYAGKWVAYSGERQLGIGRSKGKLYQQCLRQGFDDDEFLVRSIEPEIPDDLDWEEFRDI
jgi:Family of unknown function (DUF5678)